MYFDTKNYLKNNRYYIVKDAHVGHVRSFSKGNNRFIKEIASNSYQETKMKMRRLPGSFEINGHLITLRDIISSPKYFKNIF